MKEELAKLSTFLCEWHSDDTFPGDIVASLLGDISCGVSAEDIIEDLKENYLAGPYEW
jgi:hypothetical protein